MSKIRYSSPIGLLTIEEENNKIIKIESYKEDFIDSTKEVFDVAIKELEEFFAGVRKEFSFPLFLKGTIFQQKVWNALINIPYGMTKTYKEIAILVGNPNASRAVGGACNKNPLLLAVPCHRVIGSNKNLTGFAIGLDIKQVLLDLEKDKQ